MAKDGAGDITFDKLANINLEAPSHIEDIQKKEIEDEVVPVAKEVKATVKSSFKLEKDLHLGLKQYCLIHELKMADLVFETIVKSFLIEKGFYPPQKAASQQIDPV